MHKWRVALSGIMVAVVGASLLCAEQSSGAAAGDAPGSPGELSRFDLGRKDCLGTAVNPRSKVWYTVAGGVLSDVYEPTVDNSNVTTLEYVVTDGKSFTDLQTRDMTYTVSADPSGMSCTVTATSAKHNYRLVTTYITDPARDSVVMHTQLLPMPDGPDPRALRLYSRLDAHINGNGGGGSSNGGADSGNVTTVDGSAVPVVSDTSAASQATNRDYAVPTFAALRSGAAADSASVGYAGTPSDGLSSLDATHTLGSGYPSAPNGHIAAVADVTPKANQPDVTLALGFGRTSNEATTAAGDSLAQPFTALQQQYEAGWNDYDSHLRQPPANQRTAYFLSANVLKASEDKTFTGAIAAGLASPWGQAVSAGDLVDGKPVYFGSYREVFARDLYETVTGLLLDGDIQTARDAVSFLFDRQQQADGGFPRNSLENGRTAPDTGGHQLDETAYPILAAYQAGMGGDNTLWTQHVQRAADYLVAHGPSFGIERWEEQSGYSPSTIAAEIAGLSAAAKIATQHGDTNRAELYQATADHYQRNIKNWTVTTTGPDAPRYFIRLSKTGDPNAAISYKLGNGGPTVEQRQVIDGGFQELVRLGELPADDPDVRASLPVLDKQISANTPSGTGYYRYGTNTAAGSVDGYGDCYHPSLTSCPAQGQPWPTTDTGTGHPWPVLSGERAETDIASGDLNGAAGLLAAMGRFGSGVGLQPEQVWEDPDLPAAPYGTDPTTASIGFTNGRPAGSAAPLTWAQAQHLRLVLDHSAGRVLERPDVTTARYVDHQPPGQAPLTLNSPVQGGTVSGTTAPGAHVVVESAVSTGATTSTGQPAAVTATTAGPDGRFSVSVPMGGGTNVFTASSTTATGPTGYAQTTVTSNS